MVVLLVSLVVASLGVVPWASAATVKPTVPIAETTIPVITETWPGGEFRMRSGVLRHVGDADRLPDGCPHHLVQRSELSDTFEFIDAGSRRRPRWLQRTPYW